MSGCSDGSCSTGSCSTCSSDPDRLPPGMLKKYDLNSSTADGTLVWAETEKGRLARSSAELIAASSRISDGRVFVALFGGPEMKALYPEIFGYGADTVYHVRGGGTERYAPEAYAEALAQVAERVNPATILIGATPRGRETAPRLASMLGAGLTADCTGISADGRRIVVTRPAFGGALTADIECIGFPQMATVRQGVFPTPARREGKGTAIYWQYSGKQPKDVVSERQPSKDASDISDARVLIALGAGIRDRSVIDLAERIAASVDGAMVCCSRALVERGWMPQSRQVGMSGRIVRPDVYIALGISGSVQHVAGMSGAKRVIAVNTDEDAPIHSYADLSIISDAEPALRELAKMI
ncbi:MAG: electron transfer flavoprotein subunit alpha/FixB family protein [Candidatus Methanomethylophilaceae archaeon]|nr:electron transfer flavoprotein subunit alpha/FixB family protein [Candidatus Methanomethylophilaceae archaeon]